MKAYRPDSVRVSSRPAAYTASPKPEPSVTTASPRRARPPPAPPRRQESPDVPTCAGWPRQRLLPEDLQAPAQGQLAGPHISQCN